jgi:putative hydrolase of the HAD superfamily
VQEHFPADHYVMFDDKLRILDALKNIWGTRVTTVWVKQGHYAHTAKYTDGFLRADVTLEHIAEALEWNVEQLVAAASARHDAVK